ncbi:DUF6192 family protein [Streptomyces venezuelae]|uniref:RacO protein n=1 Tax=Streptomyces venezuelae TaxID=54571 RepID=A0A5P2BDE0_STRVZ|nr:DUF6192 family protein [Streptomyces venezuelae]QES28542.1 hypothetical protein DEJ47_20785 [Streptomyces venezuelae]
MTTLTVPGGYTKTAWEKIVRRGRKLMKEKSGIQWALGDLVIEALDGHSRGHGEVTQVLKMLSHQIGANPETLRSYYDVARQWPKAKRRKDVSFSVHATLAYVPSRYTLIRKDPYDPFTKEHRWTVNEAEKVANRAVHTPTNQAERLAHTRRLLHTEEDAAKAVTEMLGRPDVRARLASDQHARHLMRQAQYEHWREVDEATEAEAELVSADDAAEVEEEFDEEAAPLGVQYSEAPMEILRLIGAFASFSVSLQRIIPEVHTQDYTEETKQAVLDNVHKARMLLDWCETAIKTGKTDPDKALARLMKDEEGE